MKKILACVFAGLFAVALLTNVSGCPKSDTKKTETKTDTTGGTATKTETNKTSS